MTIESMVFIQFDELGIVMKKQVKKSTLEVLAGLDRK